MQSIPPLHANRSVISNRANVGFIPATGLAPCGLAGCSAVVPWQATSPLFQSPHGAPFGPSATRVTYYALCRLLPFVRLGLRLAQLAWVHSLAPTIRQISRGKTRYLHCIDAGFTKCTQLPQMEDFAVTCPLAPDASRLISGFCSSSRSFGLDFLQTPPRDDALALLLAFGSAKTWP